MQSESIVHASAAPSAESSMDKQAKIGMTNHEMSHSVSIKKQSLNSSKTVQQNITKSPSQEDRFDQIKEQSSDEDKYSATLSEDSKASEKAVAPSEASFAKHGSSSKEIIYKRPIKGYVEQANKQTQVTKTEIIEEKGDRKFICQTCGEVFAHGQALGGHMSRTHPRSSTAYNKKVQRRREREVDRELLRLAKIKHADEYGDEAPIDRVKIRRYKKELRKSVNRGTLVLELES